MRWIFWGSASIIAYAYVGYCVILAFGSRFFAWPVHRRHFFPTVSIVMVVRNEEQVVARKMENLMRLDYPSGQVQIVAVSDGSEDRTNEVLARYANESNIKLILSRAQGKAEGINLGVQESEGEIVLFVDARQRIEQNALRLLMENFADPGIGCASGELRLGDAESGESIRGMGIYWSIEKWIRANESALGSVVGATGSLYAARRHLIPKLPPETVLDDMYIPLDIAKKGLRVIFDPRAVAWDAADLGTGKEFRRKVRTLSGNYELLRLCPWLLSWSNPLWFQFLSHKVARLLVPIALVALLLSSALLHSTFYRVALALQLALYGLSVIGTVKPRLGVLSRLSDAALTFVLLNSAALVAFAYFVSGHRASWQRSGS